MKNIITILLLTNFGFAQNIQLDTNSILIGEQTNLTISNELNKTSIWPDYTDFIVDGIEVIQASKLDTNNNIISQTLTITAWDSGSYYIPAIEFCKDSKSEGLLLNVTTVILEEDAELKDIKEPLKEPIGWSDIWPWLLGTIIIILIAYLIYYLLKQYSFTTKDEIQKPIPKIIIAPDITAIKRLKELERAKLWQIGNIKEYHAKISEIIRRYTEERFGFIALELTTDEILNELKSRLKTQQLDNLFTLLQRADLAKFAKSKPSDSDNTESMALAIEFVLTTKVTIKDE